MNDRRPCCSDSGQGSTTTGGTVEFGDDNPGHARKGVERGGHGSGGLTDLCVDDQPSVGRSRQSGDAFQFLNEFLIELVASCRINDDQIS